MAWVTEEEYQAAKQVRAYEYLQTYQPGRLKKTRTRNEWQLQDHDSFKINEITSKWHWKSRGIGGMSALRFLIIPAKDVGILQEREQGRGSNGGEPDPFLDLFHLRTYAGTVYLLYIDGKCVPDFKRQPAISYGGSMEAFSRGNLAVQDHGEWGAVCSRLLLGRGRLSGRYGIFADYCETAFCSTRSNQRSREGDV